MERTKRKKKSIDNLGKLSTWKIVFKGFLQYNKLNSWSLGQWNELKITIGESSNYINPNGGSNYITKDELFILLKGNNDGLIYTYDYNGTLTLFKIKNNGEYLECNGTDSDNDCVIQIRYTVRAMMTLSVKSSNFKYILLS